MGEACSGQITRRAILHLGISALVLGAFVGGADSPLGGMIAALSVLVIWFPLATYRPALRWAKWLRSAAYSATVVYAGSLCVLMRSAQVLTTRGDFWIVRLPFGHWVHLPHPYDGYVGLLTKYLLLVSLILTVACSAACLCVWCFGKLKVKAPSIAKPLS
jgi:hypothetical protein